MQDDVFLNRGQIREILAGIIKCMARVRKSVPVVWCGLVIVPIIEVVVMKKRATYKGMLVNFDASIHGKGKAAISNRNNVVECAGSSMLCKSCKLIESSRLQNRSRKLIEPLANFRNVNQKISHQLCAHIRKS